MAANLFEDGTTAHASHDCDTDHDDLLDDEETGGAAA